MRKEIYNAIKERLTSLCVNAIGEYYVAPADMDTDLCNPVVKHIGLWNRNVEFIEQETAWERPAVFIEFEPILWRSIVPGVEYRAEARVRLHIVTDWASSESDETNSAISMLDLPDHIHDVLAGLEGKAFTDFTLEESHTNHNHEDIVENIEVYSCVVVKSISGNA